MDQALARRRPGPALGGDVGQPRAERQHEVGLGEGGALRVRVPQAEVAGVERVRVREQVLPPEGDRDGQLPGLGEAQQRRAPVLRCRSACPASRIGRSAARSMAASRAASSGEGGAGRGSVAGGRRRRAGHGQHVLRQGEHHRPRHAAHGHRVAARDQLRHLLRLRRLAHPLRHAAEHPRVVDLLEGVAAEVALLDLPDQQDQRHRILLRGVDGDGGVAGAGAARDQHHAGPAGQLRVRHRHEARAALRAAGDEVERGVGVQRVEQRDVALARHAEGAVHALEREELDQAFGGGRHVADDPSECDGGVARGGAAGKSARARGRCRVDAPGRRARPCRRIREGRHARQGRA